MSEKTTTTKTAPKTVKTEKTSATVVEKKAEKDFVLINSTVTINVTMGLQAQDATNPDAHVPDRLKVNPLWPKATVLIKQGAHYYPAMIAEWPTVKALAKDKLLTVGPFSDTCDGEETEAAQKKEELTAAIREVKARQTGSLEDIAEE